jgi:hypothetical protein
MLVKKTGSDCPVISSDPFCYQNHGKSQPDSGINNGRKFDKYKKPGSAGAKPGFCFVIMQPRGRLFYFLSSLTSS